MEKYKKHRSFFDDKTCNICKKRATTFRLIRDKTFVICDDKECDKYTKKAVGIFGNFGVDTV